MISFCQYLLPPIFSHGSLFLPAPLFQHELSAGHGLAALPVFVRRCGQPTHRPQSLRAVPPLAGSSSPATSPTMTLSTCLLCFLLHFLLKHASSHSFINCTFSMTTTLIYMNCKPNLSPQTTGINFVPRARMLSKSPPLTPGSQTLGVSITTVWGSTPPFPWPCKTRTPEAYKTLRSSLLISPQFRARGVGFPRPGWGPSLPARRLLPRQPGPGYTGPGQRLRLLADTPGPGPRWAPANACLR